MEIKTRTFRGLTFDILVEEAQSVDAHGGRIWYTAAVYLRLKGDGIRVFDKYRQNVA
jgi:nitrous oxidase accessory protein NosD